MPEQPVPPPVPVEPEDEVPPVEAELVYEPPEQALGPRVYRFQKRHNGDFEQRVTGMGVNRGSTVLASITELSGLDAWDYPKTGAARMEVLNITPFDNGHTWFRLRVNWGSPLPFRVSILVFYDPATYVTHQI